MRPGFAVRARRRTSVHFLTSTTSTEHTTFTVRCGANGYQRYPCYTVCAFCVCTVLDGHNSTRESRFQHWGSGVK